jgi:hypothetical protein
MAINPSGQQANTTKKKPNLLSKSWLIFILIAIFISASLVIPFVPKDTTQYGKIYFSFSEKTERIANNADQVLNSFEVTSKTSNDVEITVNNEDGKYIKFENRDWEFSVALAGSSLGSKLYNVTHTYYDPPSTVNRKEELPVYAFIKLYLNYTDKLTDIPKTVTAFFLSQDSTGIFKPEEYFKYATDLSIPTNVGYNFNKISFINKLTNGTIQDYYYDSEKEVYVANLRVDVSYEVEYSTTKTINVSILESEADLIKTALIGAIVTALVAAGINLFKNKAKNDKQSLTPDTSPSETQ